MTVNKSVSSKLIKKSVFRAATFVIAAFITLSAYGSEESNTTEATTPPPTTKETAQTYQVSQTKKTAQFSIGSDKQNPSKPYWRKLSITGKSPGRRTNHAMASIDSAVYLFGGSKNGESLGDLWQFSSKNHRWSRITTKGAAPQARFGHNLVAEPKGTLILFGGQSDTEFFNDLWRFDPPTSTWQKLSSSAEPKPRYGAAAGIDQSSGAFYVSHGFTDQGRFNDTWNFAQNSFSEVSGIGKRPLKRCLVQGIFAGKAFYIFGGQSDPKPFLGDLWKLNTTTKVWRQLKPNRLPAARNLYAATSTGQGWLIHGGASQNGFLDDLWWFDLKRERFIQLKITNRSVPSARAKHAAATIDHGKAAVLFGGEAASGELADTWILKL